MSSTMNIAVLGSLFVDHIMIADRMPDRGETFPANSYQQSFGGKGANAAVAAFRYGHKKPAEGDDASTAACADHQIDTKVRIIATAGHDYATQFRDDLAAKGVDSTALRAVDNVSTALSFIIVEQDSRHNWILSFHGANHSLFPEDFPTPESLGNGVKPDLVICNLELPMKTIEHVLEMAGGAGIDIVLNAAPADQILLDRYIHITHLLVNETEAAILSGLDENALQDMSIESWRPFAKNFLAEGVQNVVITIGERGAVYANKEGEEGHVDAFPVQVADPTGAGDTFTGVYAAEYLRQKTMQEGWDIRKAVVQACKAAALSITAVGTQAGIPWSDQVEEMIVDNQAALQLGKVDDQTPEAAQ